MYIKFVQMMKRARENQKGFTLVELIVVVVILGIIATLLISNFSSTITLSKTKKDALTHQNIQNAVERYKAANDQDIPTLAELKTQEGWTADPTSSDGTVYSISTTTGIVSP